MCGILALVATPWQHCALAALATLDSRGPDARALWTHEDATLGHARLAVIDLAGGAQPMLSEDGENAIVFNGEIYNFRALRSELQALGHRFATRSDTEVLLAGWLRWGPALLPKLDGMFAFAVWNTRSRRLFAARDRFGIKPLFWSAQRGFSLASTLAPFFALEGFERAMDMEALRDFLAFQVALAPQSFLRGVQQLPPAHSLVWDAATGRSQISPYWSIPQPTSDGMERAEAVARLDGLLRDAVASQLVADVPLGAFLSGGIDSSLMLHYMAEAGARPIRTFSMRFVEAGYDESAIAAQVARHYGCEHQLIEAPQIDADTLEQAVAALDQPLADPAFVATTVLARATRRQVTVAISGDGGDELFGGYPRFLDTEDRHPDGLTRRLLRAALSVGLVPAALLRRSLAGQDLLFYRRVELGPWPGSRKGLAAYLTPQALAECRPEATLARWRELANAFGGRMDSASLMRADLWTYLSENCLAKTDRASMAWGLEVRVPLLANAVADFALAQPAATHLQGGGHKALLAALARDKLPEAVWNRPKHGFSVPLQSYFQGPWRDLGEGYVARCAQLAPFLRADAVQALWRSALLGRGSRRLAFSLIVLLMWLARHRVG